MDSPICQEGTLRRFRRQLRAARVGRARTAGGPSATPAPNATGHRPDPADRFIHCSWYCTQVQLVGGILEFAGGHEYDGCEIIIEFPAGTDTVSDADMEPVFKAARVLINAQLAELRLHRPLAP